MEKTDVIEKLIHFNLTRSEALVYISLWEHGNMSGYEASKLTGISRSNVYGALNGLVYKGAAVITETSTTLYSAVNPEEFLSHKLRHLIKDKQDIVEGMPKGREELEGYITIQGSQNIKDKIYQMIHTCDMRLYMAANKGIIEEFYDVLYEAKKKELKIVLMCDEDYSHLATKFYKDISEPGQVRLITDSAYVLTGELKERSSDTCLYSGQKNLVTIMKEALRNKIRLLEMEKNNQSMY